MIDFYTYSTFNGRRVSIMLEETGLEYQAHKIDLFKGEQKKPEFLKINPSGRIPAIIDHDENLILTQSAAILMYLAEKSGLLMPSALKARAKIFEWLFFHATDITPTLFDSFYLSTLCESKQPQAADLLNQRVFNLYQNFDDQLKAHEFIGGEDYSIADIAMFPAIQKDNTAFFQKYVHIKRWYEQISKRDAVQRGMKIPE